MAIPLSNISLNWANSQISYTAMGFTINASAYDPNSKIFSFNVKTITTNTSFQLTTNNSLVFTTNGAQSIIGSDFGSLFFRTSSVDNTTPIEYLRISNTTTTISTNNLVVNSNTSFNSPVMINSPLSAGLNSYGNTNEILVSQGNLVPPIWKPGGKLLQVQAARTSAARQSITSITPVAVTGLSISFTPLSNTSNIIIMAQMSVTKSEVVSFGIFKDGAKTVTTAPNVNNNEADMQTTIYESIDNAQLMSIPVYHFEPSLNRTTRTYQVYATAGWAGAANIMYINNRSTNDMASFSHMIIFEVEG